MNNNINTATGVQKKERYSNVSDSNELKDIGDLVPDIGILNGLNIEIEKEDILNQLNSLPSLNKIK